MASIMVFKCLDRSEQRKVQQDEEEILKELKMKEKESL